MGAFNQGFLYSLKPEVNRIGAYGTLSDVLNKAAAEVEGMPGMPSLYQDTLRPNRIRSWETYFFDQPGLGGEVSALAGYHGITLATLNDARLNWGTPYDRPERMDLEFARQQNEWVGGMIRALSEAPKLHDGEFPRNGLSAVTGRVNLLRHGELFADQTGVGYGDHGLSGASPFLRHGRSPSVFLKSGVWLTTGMFMTKSSWKGINFDPVSGQVVWAIDKKQTGKDAYRVKMSRQLMETALVMFSCRQTTIFNLLEPRSFPSHDPAPDPGRPAGSSACALLV